MPGPRCPKCNGPMSCLAGHSAHHANWYCDDEEGCGFRAWEPTPIKVASPPSQDHPFNEQELAILINAMHEWCDYLDNAEDIAGWERANELFNKLSDMAANKPEGTS